MTEICDRCGAPCEATLTVCVAAQTHSSPAEYEALGACCLLPEGRARGDDDGTEEAHPGDGREDRR
jgi:hypothetical protein